MNPWGNSDIVPGVDPLGDAVMRVGAAVHRVLAVLPLGLEVRGRGEVGEEVGVEGGEVAEDGLGVNMEVLGGGGAGW